MGELEIWKPIVGWEGLYEVSNLGRVRSLDRIVNSHGGKRVIRGQTIKNRLGKTGYQYVALHKNDKETVRYIHRLVAEAFIHNPYNLPQVNHKDENKSNNMVSNLEWCTQQYNLHYGKRDEICRQMQFAKRNNKKESKPVICYTLNGDFVAQYPSLHEAERQTGIKQDKISRVCRGIYQITGGYKWKFV